MMHLEAIIERNRKPAPQPYKDYKDMRFAAWSDRCEWRDIVAQAVSPMVSIDAAPLPEYMQGR